MTLIGRGPDDRQIVRGLPCVLCGAVGRSDPHHWPVRKSGGAGDSMYEMVPVCRLCHDQIHRGNRSKIAQLEVNGKLHYDYMRTLYG